MKTPKWTPFERATRTTNAVTGREIPIPEGDEIYLNSRYQVTKHEVPRNSEDMPRCMSLSIRNLDRSARHDWRDFQRIKNELCGPEWEGVEIYPAESRLVDTANQFWLWVFEPPFRIPVGFDDRVVSESGAMVGAVQRPFSAEERPADLKDFTREEVADMLSASGINPEAFLKKE